MSIPPWNSDWEAMDEAQFIASASDPGVFYMFWQAARERARAVASDAVAPIFDGEPQGYPLGGQFYDSTARGWRFLMRTIVYTLSIAYLRTYEEDGVTPWTHEGKPYMLSWSLPTSYGGTSSTPPPFPPPVGFRRKYRREIRTLDYPGQAGQRARFTTYLNNFFWAAKCGFYDNVQGQDFGATVATPPDQRRNGGLTYDHDGSGWVLSEDQETPADVVEDYGLPIAGDLFGGWILNDLKRAFNYLTVTVRKSPLSYGISKCMVSLSDNGFRSIGAGVRWDNKGEANQKGASAFFSVSALQDAWDITPASTTSSAPGKIARWQDPSLNAYSSYSYLMAGLPNPDDRERRITYWVMPWANTGTGYDLYDFYGIGAAEDQWSQLAAPILTSDVTLANIKFGDLEMPVPVTSESRHCVLNEVVAVIDWTVEGGFQYTALT